MNRYIIPICFPEHNKIKNIIISAQSENDCKERIIQQFADFSESDDYDMFIQDCKGHGLLIGEINDLDTI